MITDASFKRAPIQMAFWHLNIFCRAAPACGPYHRKQGVLHRACENARFFAFQASMV